MAKRKAIKAKTKQQQYRDDLIVWGLGGVLAIQMVMMSMLVIRKSFDFSKKQTEAPAAVATPAPEPEHADDGCQVIEGNYGKYNCCTKNDEVVCSPVTPL
jgi:hypothetical protein